VNFVGLYCIFYLILSHLYGEVFPVVCFITGMLICPFLASTATGNLLTPDIHVGRFTHTCARARTHTHTHTSLTALRTKHTACKCIGCCTFMSLKGLTAVKKYIAVLYVITLCVMVGGHRCLGGSMTLRNVVNYLRDLKLS
jgi:hypothetical protein